MHYVESIFFQWNLTIANMKPGHLTNVDSSQVPQQNCKLHVTSEGHSERNIQSRNLICTISGDQQNWLASVHVKCHYRILTNFFFKNYDVSFLCDHVILNILKRSLIVLGFNDTSTLEGHFVSSPREREKRDRRESRGDEREGQGRKRNRNESEETEEIKTFPLYPYPLQG